MGENTIKILIEGDASGLTSVMKNAVSTVVSNVNKMNDQQVNWDSILTSTLSGTVIATVAATMANAIAQYANFTSAAVNLNNIATPATAAFANSITTAGGQAYTMAQSAGQSLGDTASSYEAFSKAGLDSAAATTAVSDASGIAYATGESYTSVVSELVNLFQQWGVTTTPQVTAALTGLTNAAQNGKFSFDELVATLTPQGQLLQTKTNISDTATSLATLSAKTGLAKATIVDTFNAISAASQSGSQAAITMSAGFGGAATAITTGPTGLITAFSDIKSSIDKEGPLVANSFGSQVGIMGTDVAGFGDASTKGFGAAQTAAATLQSTLIPLSTILENSTSPASKLASAWNNFKNSMAEFVLPSAFSVLTGSLEELNTLITSAGKGGATGFFGELGNELKDLVSQKYTGSPGTQYNTPSSSSTATTITNNVTVQSAGGTGSTGSAQITGSAIAKQINNKTLP